MKDPYVYGAYFEKEVYPWEPLVAETTFHFCSSWF